MNDSYEVTAYCVQLSYAKQMVNLMLEECMQERTLL